MYGSVGDSLQVLKCFGFCSEQLPVQMQKSEITLGKGDLEMFSKKNNRIKKVKAPGFPESKKLPQESHPLHHYKFDDNPIVERALQRFKEKKIPQI